MCVCACVCACVRVCVRVCVCVCVEETHSCVLLSPIPIHQITDVLWCVIPLLDVAQVDKFETKHDNKHSIHISMVASKVCACLTIVATLLTPGFIIFYG